MNIIGGHRMKKKCILILLLLIFTNLAYSKEICEIDRETSIVERVENRTYPSVFGAWSHELLNYPRPDDIYEWSYIKEMLAHNDLFWGGTFRAIQWRLGPEGNQLVVNAGSLEYSQYERTQLQELNSNFLLLSTLYHYGAILETYPEDWPYWLRDKSGNRIQDVGWQAFLIDYTHPGAQDHFVQRAAALAKCGLFDGIFLDWWDESPEWDQEMADLYHSSKVDAQVSLVRRIREVVGEDFLIIVNTNTRKVPRSAPYVNGSFMETIGPVQGYSRERLIEIENALLWYQENFRYPQVNCLEGWGLPSEPLNAPRNEQTARVFITLSLTHSDGYVSFTTGIGGGSNHEHAYEIWPEHSEEHLSGASHAHLHHKYWYSFYDAPLGRPVGGDETKAQVYENTAGLFIREFTNGWAVYNRSGKEQQIELPENVSGVANGVTGTRHVLADLDGEIYLKAIGIPADINADGTVNILDLVLVANGFGNSEPDLNGDGIVNILDLVLVANAFGGPQE